MADFYYKTKWSAMRCWVYTWRILLLLAILSMPFFFLCNNVIVILKVLVALFIVSTFLLWIIRLRVSEFYDDHVEIRFPLRPFRRKICISYEEIESLTYGVFYIWPVATTQSLNDAVLLKIRLKSGTPQQKRNVYRNCSSILEHHFLVGFVWLFRLVIRSFKKDDGSDVYFPLLTFLKDKGLEIRCAHNTEEEKRVIRTLNDNVSA